MEYKSDWPGRFTQIASYLLQFLSEKCSIHHIESTSIPGMPAKNIIDLDIEHEKGDSASIVDCLKNAGYDHLGDLGLPGREAFKPRIETEAAQLPEHHLYTCETGAYELQKHLAFRDYLRTHPERAIWLSKKKWDAAATAKNKEEYIDNKSIYYQYISKESLDWFRNRDLV